MAFSEHPHQLEITAKNTTKGTRFSDEPFVLDRRGRKIYKWDAYYSSMGPEAARKRNVWDLAEYLDEQRLQEERTRDQLLATEEAANRRLDHRLVEENWN